MKVPSRVIGAIKVGHDYSLVEVPESLADRIMGALAKATIRGKTVKVRPYRED